VSPTKCTNKQKSFPEAVVEDNEEGEEEEEDEDDDTYRKLMRLDDRTKTFSLFLKGKEGVSLKARAVSSTPAEAGAAEEEGPKRVRFKGGEGRISPSASWVLAAVAAEAFLFFPISLLRIPVLGGEKGSRKSPTKICSCFSLANRPPKSVHVFCLKIAHQNLFMFFAWI
jgi:hypothetical protein